jgi:hypothetical protein
MPDYIGRKLIMISFKNFLKESQWMYHGSVEPNLNTIQANKTDYGTIDSRIGAHFAADPEISRKFAKGLYKKTNSAGNSNGAVYKTKSLKRSELHVIPQKTDKWSGQKESDQHAVAAHVLSTVLSHPKHKEMFKTWVTKFHHVNDKTADEIHDHLSKGKAPVDKEKFGMAAHEGNSFKSYFKSFDSEDMYEPEKGFSEKLISHYHDIMKAKGKKGLVYQNTAPKEKEGVRSTKNYIVFEPENLKIEKHEEMK